MTTREWDSILAGRLAHDSEVTGRHSVFINKHYAIQFSIKIMSDSPDELAHVEYFTSYANRLPDFHDDDVAPDQERIESLRTYLTGKIILFKPIQKIHAVEDRRYYLAEPVAVLEAPAEISENSRLIPILQITDMEPNEFEERVLNRRPVAPYQRRFPKDMPVADPISVLVDSWLYGPFEKMDPVMGGWLLRGNDIRKVQVDLDEYESLVLPFRNIVFVEDQTYFRIWMEKLSTEGVVVVPADTQLLERHMDVVETGEVRTIHVDIAAEEVRRDNSGLPVTTRSGERSEPEPTSEAGFLERLRRVAQAKRLFYDENDLINFHTALKTGSLVLLTGMSGTGKTRLVQVYAEALGLEPEKQFRIIPIRPTWTDGTDLLGFLDLTNNLYRPSESGLLELLLDAQGNPDKLYLVCFDEMNLARAEHYFAQFISVLELDPKYRYIDLYSRGDAGRIYNAHMYPPRVYVGENVMFVGTVNVDESTYAFSDKVLDRAQVIRPKVLPFSSLRAHLEQRVGPIEPLTISFPIYNGWKRTNTELGLTSAELEFLEHVHNEMNSVDQQLGIGYRTLRQIDVFLQNIPVDSSGQQVVERSIAFDWQVVQKVLTKLRGPRELLERLVGVVNEAGEVVGSALIRLMDENESLSSFTASRAVIQQKARELSTYGYAS